jgi:hypothetical protein
MRPAIYGGIVTLCVLLPTAIWADSVVETARLLAILLDSGRVVVGINQSLINDKTKGDKGFTPDVFEEQVRKQFQERTGVTVDNVPAEAKPLIAGLIAAARETVNEYQPIINMQGKGFKHFTPAHFGRETAARFSKRTGVTVKQTTTDNLLRNPDNKADDFELSILQKFASPDYPRTSEAIVSATDDQWVRVMLPLFYGKHCLDCHGGPKGERDISGYRKDGAKEGDLGGAISVKMPVR